MCRKLVSIKANIVFIKFVVLFLIFYTLIFFFFFFFFFNLGLENERGLIVLFFV